MVRFRGWNQSAVTKLGGKKVVKKVKAVNPYIERIARELTEAKIPFTREYKFHPTRKWRFDFAVGASKEEIESQRIAIEFNGAVFTQGGHTRGAGYVKDMEKMNNAQVLGFRVLQYTSMDFRKDGLEKMIEQIKALMR